MIRILYFASAVEVLQTYPDGRLDVNGLFVDALFATSLPVSAPKLAIVYRLEWDRTEETAWYDGHLEVVGPSGDTVDRMEMKVEAFPTASLGRINQTVVLDGFPFRQHGTYRFRMVLGGATAECVFNVLPASEA